MRKSRFTETQIIGLITEQGLVCRQLSSTASMASAQRRFTS